VDNADLAVTLAAPSIGTYSRVWMISVKQP
jgi:peptide deformylase